MYRRRIVAALAVAAAAWLARGVGAVPAGQAKPGAPLTDLDAFMSRVLERRNENWKTLHDYILSERETFQILGPGGIPLSGQRREFQWFIRDGYLVRSPVKANGASLSEADRRKYEADWLKKEQSREQRAREKAAKKDKAAKQGADSVEAEVVEELRSIDPGSDKEVVAMVGTEPRFISEAYFMKFPFEPGNYYLAGRETIDGRPVVKIEYYPTRLFTEDEEREKKDVTITAGGDVKVQPAGEKPPGKEKPKKAAKRDKEDDLEHEIEAALNKVTMVTMWIESAGVPDRPVRLRQRRLGVPAGPRHCPRGPGEGHHGHGTLLRQRLAAEGDRVHLRRDLRGRVVHLPVHAGLLRLSQGRGQREDPGLRPEGALT